MSITTKLLSYSLIIEYLEIHGKSTAEELMSRLDQHELPSSIATFERLKLDLNNFGFKLLFEDQSYRLEKGFNPYQHTLLHLFKLTNEANLLNAYLQDKNNSETILIETGNQPFYNYLSPIFKAIKDRLTIRFDYDHFDHGLISGATLNPYLLKEYKSRWYMSGYSEYSNGIRTFALDRITNLETTRDTFENSDRSGLAAKLKETIGINHSEELTTLKLKAYFPQNKYLRNLPLHESQFEIESRNDYSIYEYNLRPNYELEQELMRLSDQISILEPEWLRQKMAQRLQKALDNQG